MLIIIITITIITIRCYKGQTKMHEPITRLILNDYETDRTQYDYKYSMNGRTHTCTKARTRCVTIWLKDNLSHFHSLTNLWQSINQSINQSVFINGKYFHLTNPQLE